MAERRPGRSDARRPLHVGDPGHRLPRGPRRQRADQLGRPVQPGSRAQGPHPDAAGPARARRHGTEEPRSLREQYGAGRAQCRRRPAAPSEAVRPGLLLHQPHREISTRDRQGGRRHGLQRRRADAAGDQPTHPLRDAARRDEPLGRLSDRAEQGHKQGPRLPLHRLSQPSGAVFTHYASPNRAAEALLPPEHLKDPVVYPPPEVLARCEHLGAFPPKAAKARQQIYSRLAR